MKGTHTLQHLAQYKQQSAQQNASRMRLLKQARTGQPAAWSRAIEKTAGSLIKAGEALKAFAPRETVLNS